MKLIFVYNANSGKLNTLFDIAHKIVRPETYSCSLCSLTHGAFKEKKIWSDFKESTEVEMVFLHKDEFEIMYEKQFSYPIILKEEKELEEFISTEQLESLEDENHLISLLKERIMNQ